MNIPILPHWGQFAGLVLLETLLILLFAAGVAGLCRSAMWKRTIWQVALVAGLLVLLCELAGVTRMAAGWMAVPGPLEPAAREIVVTRGEAPVWGETPTRSGAGGSAGLMVPIENAGPAGSWWPGLVWMGGLICWTIWFARGRWFCWWMAR
ncbi:MAG TPA: hypothetical protein VMS21_04715, partial [Methylomirabilota bacterium]|nr:hypothetical protein [Methylomirabilota bacterium]